MNLDRIRSAWAGFRLPGTTTPPHVNNETGISAPAADDGAHTVRRPAGDGGVRARLKKMIDTKAVPHAPALRIEGDWRTEVAGQICRSWVESRTALQAHSISLVALARMKALDYERKHRDSIPEADRLLPGNPGRQDYYEAQIEAFLSALGISGEGLAALMESFKQAGTGGLHRQHVTVAATLNGLAGGAAQLISAQHPAAAAAWYGIRLLFQIVVAERTLDSGRRRMRNAGTEDVMPEGRPDAPPGARRAPDMFDASHAVIWKLQGVKRNLRRMEAAMHAVEDARAAYDASGAEADRLDMENARKDLEIAFAKISYQMEVKAAYKASSENAKIEFRGNQRYLASSYTAASLTLGAGMFSILTPVLGVAAAPATGGVTVGIAALVMALYAAYQLSSGPSRDGEAKLKRTIVALSKSIDVLSGDRVAGREKRAAAYKSYLEDLKAARYKVGNARKEARETAKAALSEQLEEILAQDTVEDLMDARRCWDAYSRHRRDVSAIDMRAAQEQWPQEQIAEQKKKLDDQFEAAHHADFATQTIADAWKDPVRIRMETAGRLLKGKVARSQMRLINLTRHPGLKARITRNNDDRAIAPAKAELRQNLRDMVNLELALHHMQGLIDRSAGGDDFDSPEMARAALAIGAIEDADVRNVFCGDGKEQVEAANKAKKLTAGEAERYFLTNAGASAIPIGLNAAVGATDVGIAAAKASGAVHVGLQNPNPEGLPRIPEYTDYKFAAISQAGAPLTAHMNAGDRTAFRKTQMPKILKLTAREKGQANELAVHLSSDASHLEEDNAEMNEKLDTLVEQLANAASVPDEFIVSLASRDPETSEADGAAGENLVIDLRSTSGYCRADYENASTKTKLKVAGAKARILGSHVWLSLAGLPAQGIAQLNLKRTREPLGLANLVDPEVRRILIDTAAAGAVPAGPKTPSVPEAETHSTEVAAGDHEEESVVDVEMDDAFELIRLYYQNEARLEDERDGIE